MYGPSDMYGDLNAEDLEEFGELQPNDEKEIDPDSRFQRDEFRSFDRDFEEELDNEVHPDDIAELDEIEEEYWYEDGDNSV